MRTLQKTVVIILGVVAFTVLFSFIVVGPYYYSSRPRQADAHSGRIFRERVKGPSGVADVYLTRTEKLSYNCAGWITGASGLIFLTAALLNRRWKVVRNLALRGWEFPK